MAIEFHGGPLDDEQVHPNFKAENEVWLVGHQGKHFAIYIRKAMPDGHRYFEFDRICDEQEAEEMRQQHGTN